MGCGSSSLKGEDVNVNAPQPVSTTPAGPKRIRTDFASVDYDQNAGGARRMTEYAPHETVKVKKSQDTPRHTTSSSGQPSLPSAFVSGAPENAGQPGLRDGVPSDSLNRNTETKTFPHEGVGFGEVKADKTDEIPLQPYKTVGDDSWDDDTNNNNVQPDNQSKHHHAHANGTHEDFESDPTTARAKTEFAKDNDPASLENQQSRHHNHSNSSSKSPDLSPAGPGSASSGSEERKKSWLGDKYSKYQAMKTGRNQQISDEELKKYTGMDRKQLKEWGDAREGVAGNQSAGKHGSENARAVGAGWTAVG